MQTSINDLVTPQANPLDPCPLCNARPHESPESVHTVHSALNHPGANAGDAKWHFPHCWRCGFRPGTNVAVNEGAMRAAFERFKEMYGAHIEGLMGTDPRQTLSAPPTDPDTIAELNRLREQLAESQRELATLKPPEVGEQ